MKNLIVPLLRLLLPELVKVVVRWLRKREFMRAAWPVVHGLIEEAATLDELQTGIEKRNFVAAKIAEWVEFAFPEFKDFATARNVNWMIETVLQEITETERDAAK